MTKKLVEILFGTVELFKSPERNRKPKEALLLDELVEYVKHFRDQSVKDDQNSILLKFT